MVNVFKKVVRDLRDQPPAAPGGFDPAAVPRTPIDGQRPEDVRRANLRFVAETLEAAGISYVLVRADRASRSVVAVTAEDGPATVAALAASCAGTNVTVGLIRESENKSTIVMGESLAAEVGDQIDKLDLLRVFRFYADPEGSLAYGRDFACDVEFWRASADQPGWRSAPRPNVLSTLIVEDELEPVEVVDGDRSYPMARAFTRDAIDDVTFPIDAVYLWVDGSDPVWADKMRSHRPASQDEHAGARPERFRDFEELRYSLRSLDMFAPWIRHVYLVTDGQRPDYLSFDDDRITLVDHTEIADPDYLPMFNSDAIVTWLHRIPGLSEHFIYVNDDCFFGRPVAPSLFFHPSGLIKVFPSNNQRPLGPVVAGEPMPQMKAKLTRQRIEERYGRTLAQIMRHTPHPMTRTMLELVEREFAEETESTRRSRFRRDTDMPPDQMVHYLCQILGTGTRGQATYGYVNVATADGATEFEKIVAKRDRDVFCLNDAPESDHDEPDAEKIAALLHECFPVPSRWEIPGR